MKNSKLKEIRSQLGVNQEEFAEKLGITQSYYSAIERGDKAITAKLLDKLFNDVGVSSEWWYSSNGSIFSSKMSGSNVGSDVGFEEKKIKIQSAIRRFYDELKNEDPKLYQLYTDAFSVIEFQWFLKDFNKAYLHQILIPEGPNKQDEDDTQSFYAQFKQKHIESLKKIETLEPLLNKLNTAIMQFYKELGTIDSKNVIKDHFWGLKDNSIQAKSK